MGRGAPPGVRYGGRVKGKLNKQTEKAREIADRLGVDPLAILLFYASNNWKALGYKTEPKQKITHDLRIRAAQESAAYIHAKRRWVEISGVDGGPLDSLISMTPEQRAQHKREIEARIARNTIDVKSKVISTIVLDDDELEKTDDEKFEDLL